MYNMHMYPHAQCLYPSIFKYICSCTVYINMLVHVHVHVVYMYMYLHVHSCVSSCFLSSTYKEQCVRTGEEVAQLQSTVSKLMRGQNVITASLPHITTPSLSGSHPNSLHDPAAVLSTESIHDLNITDSSADHMTEVPGGGEQGGQDVQYSTIQSQLTCTCISINNFSPTHPWYMYMYIYIMRGFWESYAS